MKAFALLLLFTSLAACTPEPDTPAPQAEAPPAVETVSFEAADGVTLFGEIYRTDAGMDAPLILLFHQGGGDTRGEYGPLVPRLNDAGYHALAIDQRRGGDRFENTNRTVAALPEGTEYGYCEAYPDLEAAHRYATEAGFNGPRFAWGSSYSAALVIQLAAKNPNDFAGVLAFSPASGGPLADCRPDLFLDAVQAPLLALRPASEMQNPSTQQQLADLAARGHQTYVASNGVHGSSMLNEHRIEGSADSTWAVVLGFLENALADAE